MIDLSKHTKDTIGKAFDMSVLPKQSTKAEVIAGCEEAKKFGCASMNTSSPYWTPVVVEALAGTGILAGCGIGFPFGAIPSAVKAAETELAVKLGCGAVDMCINVGAVKSGQWDVLKEELHAFKEAAGPAITKVIMELCYLSDDEIKRVSEAIAEAGCTFAKSSTGQFEGPTMEQFLIVKETLKGSPVGLKVAGVKFPRPQNAYCFLLAGADLIGTRAAGAIISAFDTCREIGIIPPYQP
jgi:deoxyribose-phosphate aldolase